MAWKCRQHEVIRIYLVFEVFTCSGLRSNGECSLTRSRGAFLTKVSLGKLQLKWQKGKVLVMYICDRQGTSLCGIQGSANVHVHAVALLLRRLCFKHELTFEVKQFHVLLTQEVFLDTSSHLEVLAETWV